MMIDYFYVLLLNVHIIFGMTALVTFWIPLISKKGSTIHRRFGWTYTYAMIFVSLSAMFMSLIRLFGWVHSTSDDLQFAWFLLLLSFVAAGSAWEGIVVLQRKWWEQRKRLLEYITVLFAVLLAVGSAILSVYGFQLNNMLLALFPLIVGLAISVQLVLMLWGRIRSRNQRAWQMREHIVGMIGCGITTITAFTVFAVPRLMEWESAPLWLWILPTVVLNPVIMYSIRKYAK